MVVVCLSLNVDTWHNMSFKYLQAYATKSKLYPEIEFVDLEYKLHENLPKIYQDVLGSKPDILAISCYVWNRRKYFDVLPHIKEKLPNLKVITGGPEFQWEFVDEFNQYDFLDYVVVGEGEKAFLSLLEYQFSNKLNTNDKLSKISGLIYRGSNGKILSNKNPEFADINAIPSPYFSEVIKPESIKNSRAQIQTQRGCPLTCGFCYESKLSNKVRYFQIERVFAEIDYILENGADYIYFLDSTFNSNRKRAKQILKYLVKKRKKNNFEISVEVVPEFLDSETILLCKATGLKRMEMGIQSLDKKAIDVMDRFRDEAKLFANINTCVKIGLPIIAQLIYGLPGDNIKIFLRGFDKLYSLKIFKVGIFGLQLLPGTLYRDQAKILGIKFDKYSYYIIESSDFSKNDLGRLANFKNVVLFTNGIKPLINKMLTKANIKPSKFFMEFVDFRQKQKPEYITYIKIPISIGELITFIKLTEFIDSTPDYKFEFSELRDFLQNWLNLRMCDIKLVDGKKT